LPPCSLLLLVGSSFALVVGAWPAIQAFGSASCGARDWNPVMEKFGALIPIYGTLVTSLIAC
jgi:phosphate transport system permease protein